MSQDSSNTPKEGTSQAPDAYARAGVSQSDADLAVSRLVGALGKAVLGRPARQVDLSGHYAAVIRLDDKTGIALSTDGVGTKLLIAEQLERFDTVGIDCIAMNVNDIICVGAEPLAMLDYLAVEKADPDQCEQIGIGLARGAELAGIEIPGGELAQLGDLVNGFDIAGACFGTVSLDAIIDGSKSAPGDVVIGLPSSGLHSNGYTLARKSLEGLSMDDDRLGRPLGEILLEPTEIYVKPVMELIRSEEIRVHGLAHLTSGGLDNLLRLKADVTWEITDPLAPQPIFDLITERGQVPEDEMYEVFNMGCGFCVVVPEEDEPAALAALNAHYPEARRIGRVAAGPRQVIRGT
ncbi:MAG: phosphoribosylformylglycinamidine cyclo-ligase [Actinomycetota bacterium]|nr:phosphoribosylformylglycinamidine cyclo-ligase [Actinomycetota bacterium]